MIKIHSLVKYTGIPDKIGFIADSKMNEDNNISYWVCYLNADGLEYVWASEPNLTVVTVPQVPQFNNYQSKALSTYHLEYEPAMQVALVALALVGEAGEVSEKIKKVMWYNEGKFTEESIKAIALELGDVIWYVAVLSALLGFSFESIADMNIEKLQHRVLRGTIKGEGDNR